MGLQRDVNFFSLLKQNKMKRKQALPTAVNAQNFSLPYPNPDPNPSSPHPLWPKAAGTASDLEVEWEAFWPLL